MTQSLSVYRFGIFEANLRSRELLKKGVRIRLQDKPFQLLTILLEARGLVVTRDEICRRLWPEGTFVEFDDSLNSAVKKLRTALNDSAEQPRLLETVPKVGYRFIAPVSVAGERAVSTDGVAVAHATMPSNQDTQEPAPNLSRDKSFSSSMAFAYSNWLKMTAGVSVLLALTILLVLYLITPPPNPRIQSIAVLPLENLSGDPLQQYFADGMTDELITDLAKLGSLSVISRTSAMQYRGTRRPLPAIGRELHVDAVVEGSVVRAGNKVRVAIQFIDAHNDRHLWARIMSVKPATWCNCRTTSPKPLPIRSKSS